MGFLSRREIHPRQPIAADDFRLCRVGHVDRDEDIVGETFHHRGRIGPPPADIPDAVQAGAVDRHEADLPRLSGARNIEYGHSGRPVARLRLHVATVRARLRLVVIPLVGHFGLRKHVVAVHEQQQIVVNLEVKAPGVRRILDVVDRLRTSGIAHVDDREALRADMADIGIAVSHHDLLAVGAARLIGVTDQAHVVGVGRLQELRARSSSRSSEFRELSPCIRRCKGRR